MYLLVFEIRSIMKLCIYVINAMNIVQAVLEVETILNNKNRNQGKPG